MWRHPLYWRRTRKRGSGLFLGPYNHFCTRVFLSKGRSEPTAIFTISNSPLLGGKNLHLWTTSIQTSTRFNVWKWVGWLFLHRLPYFLAACMSKDRSSPNHLPPSRFFLSRKDGKCSEKWSTSMLTVRASIFRPLHGNIALKRLCFVCKLLCNSFEQLGHCKTTSLDRCSSHRWYFFCILYELV